MESQPQNPEFRNNPESFHPCKRHFIIWALSRENLSLGFPTKRGTNQSPQLQGLDRKLKFRLKQV